MKKIILYVLTVFCVAAGIQFHCDADFAFTDVQPDDYYADAVSWAVQRGITLGTSETTFSPHNSCTRAQVVTFLWRSNDSPVSSSDNPFQDVKRGAYYYQATIWATERGIAHGTSPSAFSPNQPCTYAHILTFLWRQTGSPVVSSAQSVFEGFENHWAAQALIWAECNGILNMNGETINPDSKCPRSDVVYYLYRLAEKVKKEESESMTDSSDFIYYEASSIEEFSKMFSQMLKDYAGKVEISDPSSVYASGRLIAKVKGDLPNIRSFHPACVLKDTYEHYIIQFMSDGDAERCAVYLNSLPETEYAEADGVLTADSDL